MRITKDDYEVLEEYSDLARAEQVALCMTLLSTLRHAKTIRNVHSYHMKHVVERAFDTYISNDSFILAAHYMGFKQVWQYSGPPNTFLGIYKKDLEGYEVGY